MRENAHRIIAISLSLLILVSTTGFSMNLGWCYCSNQKHISVFVPTECCSHDAATEKISSCCSSSIESISESCSQISSGNHCDFELKYVQSDINFNTSPSFDLPLFQLLFLNDWQGLNSLTRESYQIVFSPFVSNINGNKAPPILLFGKKLLQFIQVYRC